MTHDDTDFWKSGPIGIIAGNGELPAILIRHLNSLKHPFYVVGLDGFVETNTLSLAKEHILLPLGAVGKAIAFFKKNNVTSIAFAGGVKRPSLSQIKPDLTGAKLLAKLTFLPRAGDNNLLSNILTFFSQQGFQIVGADQLAQELLAPVGLLTKAKPSKDALKDIQFGQETLAHLSDIDIGQSIIVQQATIIGMEAIEGTDALITRCKNLTLPGNKAILVKCKKRHQDSRIDLPTIGPETVKACIKSGFAGIAIEAGSTLLINRKKIIALAEEEGLFIIGVE